LAGFPAGITAREMRKALRFGAPFVFVAAISALAQSNPGFRSIQRFPNPSETKTSPKSWQ
jgi:hypothetical protein